MDIFAESQMEKGQTQRDWSNWREMNWYDRLR
jgi:hypothetical protein